MRAAWSMLTGKWSATIERASRLAEEHLYVSVDDEWSFAETLRHLVYATDKWFVAPVLGGRFDPIGLPNTGTGDLRFLGIDHDARPTFAEVLASRRARVGMLTDYLADASVEDFERNVSVLEAGTRPVGACLQVVFREEWAHHQYATRDLAVLERVHGV
jgi:hypothetical protein